MKATPIAEFLARKSSETRARRRTCRRRRGAAVANDDREPDFRRSGLVAALARRPAEPALVRPLDPAAFAPRREPPPLRYPAPPPEPRDRLGGSGSPNPIIAACKKGSTPARRRRRPRARWSARNGKSAPSSRSSISR